MILLATKQAHGLPSLLVPIGLSTLIRQLSVLTQVNWTLMVRPRMVGAYVVWIEQVEELKCLLAIFPVWISGVTCFVVMDQHNTFGILQAIQTNRSIGRFEIPLDWLGMASMISLSIWITMYEQIYIPQARNFLERDLG